MTLIKLEKLDHHPLNPRKDNYGDLSELSASIAVNGVLQNLTVVPADNDTYKVIIGNRRLEAAKLAHIEEVPCNIVDMTEDEIVSTMLCENMQREDLTLYEQATGFQMMLDLGKSVSDIAEKSGFSESTVRSRTKLAALDRTAFKVAVDQGATLFEFAELEKIENEEKKTELLKKAGTKDFKNALERAKNDEREAKIIEKYVEEISKFATEANVTFSNGNYTIDGTDTKVKYEARYSSYSDKPVVIPEDEHTRYYVVGKYDVTVYVEYFEKEKTPEEILKEKISIECEKQKELAKSITERHLKLREDFIRNYSASKKNSAKITKALTKAISTRQIYQPLYKNVLNFLDEGVSGIDEESIPDDDKERFNRVLFANSEKITLILTYLILEAGKYIQFNWDVNKQTTIISYCASESQESLYELLSDLGYKPSDEELQIMSGEHEIYKNSWLDEFYPQSDEETEEN